ncbi:MAG: DEAD/DEAH box helicase [Acidobacteriota bacterium]|jgi:ATP-dependent Lhr-like helicase
MLSTFHPLVREWFESRFARPTAVQERGWPAIAEGRHTLLSAPTGSGKTLAAFLVCIDRLLRSALRGDLPDSSRVVYVSPLKALSNDVHKNLALPLREIAALARGRGIDLPEIRIALRTGDTPAYERQVMARKPPHIWITTPESLYLLLTSASGRRSLQGVKTLILDEIHAVAGNKRGSHLALSVERLCALAGEPLTRIGLSATQSPIEEVARFLVGNAHIDKNGTPDCAIVDIGHRRDSDLQIEMPADELGSVATHELWGEVVARIATLAQTHHTTLVFVNTRRLVERVAHQLSEIMGREAVVAHHGSLARKTRLLAEERLKSGEARVAVATASLELGIDIGSVDLVCQIGSPRSIGVLLQRVGRSGHSLGGVSKGRLFPLTRDELIECAALLLATRRGDLDRLSIPPWPLDVLAQQIIAMASCEAWRVEDLFRAVKRAYPYRDLTRGAFDGIVRMLADGVAPSLGRRTAFLHHDRINDLLRGRRGARLAALTCGGAIPDNADYDVVSDPDGTYLGSVTEDFAVESVGGDVFLLGNSSWRIRRVERGKVHVEDAHGLSPSVPFWLGEAPGRTQELAKAVSDVRSGIEERLDSPEACLGWLQDSAGLPRAGAEQALRYVAEGRRVLGSVPILERVVVERFFDESGGMQLVIHSPWGAGINRAWGLALRKRFCRRFDFELQASATDDGIVLSLGSQHSFPLEEIGSFLRAAQAEETLVQAVLASPIFSTRWRWTLTRSLALLRFAHGRRVPAAIQRMRADDLLSAIFPARTQCQDNHGEQDLAIPDHPLVFETLRDCLTEALDLAGLRNVLKKIEDGTVELLARDTPRPSVFAHQILNAMPYAFLDDAPLEERRARAVFLRRVLPEDAGDLGKLDPEAIRRVAADAWPAVRDADELHDLLLSLVLFPEPESRRLHADAPRWFDVLKATGRARRILRGGASYWAAIEHDNLVRGPDEFGSGGECESEQRLVTAFARGWLEVSGPVTASGLAASSGFDVESIRTALLALEGDGLVLRGRFTGGSGEEEFCDRRLLARIHRATITHLRREIEPVPASVLVSFLLSWQHLEPSSRLNGEAGLIEVVEQLQGFETAAAAWEKEIFPARIANYQPDLLDRLCLVGEVTWGRWTHRPTQAEVPAHRPGLTRTAPLGIGMRTDIAWLLDGALADEEGLSVAARNVLAFLRRRGASFFLEICAGTRHLPAEAEEGLWQLVAAGLVTADAFEGLRALVTGEARRQERSPRRRRHPRRTRVGRWSLLVPQEPIPQDRTELWARQILRRYGILLRELLAREASAPAWRELLPVLRRMEARGEIRGGRFVSGCVGEQFALPEAVASLRALRRREPSSELLRASACDPLNLAGILTPGMRIPALLGNCVIYRDGLPVAAVDADETRIMSDISPAEQSVLDRLLDPRPASAFRATVTSHESVQTLED